MSISSDTGFPVFPARRTALPPRREPCRLTSSLPVRSGGSPRAPRRRGGGRRYDIRTLDIFFGWVWGLASISGNNDPAGIFVAEGSVTGLPAARSSTGFDPRSLAMTSWPSACGRGPLGVGARRSLGRGSRALRVSRLEIERVDEHAGFRVGRTPAGRRLAWRPPAVRRPSPRTAPGRAARRGSAGR